jgi:hypothetical protein
MQAAFNQEEDLANWVDGMDDLPTFSMQPDPNGDFGGAGVG